MKALKSKVILSALVLLFALVATIGSTYAWFTVSQTVTVSQMQLKVQSVDSLLIRVANPAATAAIPVDVNLDQPSTYFTSLTTTQILANYDYASWTLSDVTSVQSDYVFASKTAKNLNKLTLSTPWLRTSLTPTSSKNGAGNDFIELKFWLYSQASIAKTIAVKDLTIEAVGGTLDQQNSVKAMRIAVWCDDNMTTGADYRFGINNDYDFKFTSAYPDYYSTVAGDLVGAGNKIIGTDPFNFIDQTVSTIGVSADHLFFNAAGGVTTNSTNVLADATTIYTIQSITPTLITVRIYMEGWDQDMTNLISAAIFNIGFKFGFKG